MNIQARRSILTALVLMLAACWTPVARAQTPPAGNAHPKTEAITESSEVASENGEKISNPFGPPEATSFDLHKKELFSRAVDLSPLRDLAVFNNGRVKVVDTLARETVAGIAGRHDYVDFDVEPSGDARKVRNVHYDPLFTFFDLLIDPAYYVNRPLVHVNYLPLRQDILRRAYPGDAGKDQREWWKRVGRLKPIQIANVLPELQEKYAFEPGYREGLTQVRTALELYRDSWRNLEMIAPPFGNKEAFWGHLSASGSSAVSSAALALGKAWRAGDAAGVNAAAAQLAAGVRAIHPASYPGMKLAIETDYNRVDPFEWGLWMYAVAVVALLLAFGTSRRWLVITGLTFLAAGLAMHAGGFVARCIIAERFAIQNQFESMTGLSLFAVLVGTTIMLLRRQWLFGAAAAGVGFLVLITATQTAIPGINVEREAPILNTSVLLKYHVTTVLVSYGLISLGCMVSLFYLGTYYFGKRGEVSTHQGIEASSGKRSLFSIQTSTLDELDTAQMIILQLAFWTLGVGILLGAWWADHSWGRWFAFDPKELWALVTWIVYLIVIHLRFTNLKNRGLTTAWLSVLGFLVMLWTYFGVNLLLPGLHAYA